MLFLKFLANKSYFVEVTAAYDAATTITIIRFNFNEY